MAVRGTTTVEPDSVIVQRGFDRAGCGELELGPHQPVAELAGLDGELLRVAGDLLAVAREHRLEASPMPVSSAGARTSTTRWGVIWVGNSATGSEKNAPVMSMRVEPPANLTELEVLDEQRRDDVHGSEASEMAAPA